MEVEGLVSLSSAGLHDSLFYLQSQLTSANPSAVSRGFFIFYPGSAGLQEEIEEEPLEKDWTSPQYMLAWDFGQLSKAF